MKHFPQRIVSIPGVRFQDWERVLASERVLAMKEEDFSWVEGPLTEARI